jgi:hypothetical protein
MKLYNNTPNAAYYGMSYGDDASCGKIAANQTIDLHFYDNKQNVKVSFVAVGKAPSGEVNPFSVTIPKSGKGMTVTIGLFQQ